MRHIPEVITWGTGFVAAFWVSLYFSSNKTLGIWSLFGAVVFGALTCFLLWQNEIWKTQQETKIQEIQTRQTETNKSKNSHNPQPHLNNKPVIHEAKPATVQEHQTVYSHLNNEQLKKEVLILVDKMRGYLERKHLQDQTKSDYYFQQMRQAKTEAERQIIWNAQTHDSLTAPNLNFEYSEKFKAEATLLHEELLRRLPNEPPNNRTHSDYEHPTNPIGLNMVIDNLEKLAKSLPK